MAEPNKKKYRLAIALIAKGSMNNLHRKDIVDAFRADNVDVAFVVREDYVSLIQKIAGCEYLTCAFPKEVGYSEFLRQLLQYIRNLYPVGAIGRRETLQHDPGVRRKVTHAIQKIAARSRMCMRFIRRLEALLYQKEQVRGLDPEKFDQLLLLGVGAHGAEHETKITWWARQHRISVVHMIGNWDTLTSKGYPGAPVDRLLVWGPVMLKDATQLHDIPEQNIRMIGAIRYDRIGESITQDRTTFLSACGLDPDKKAILFAGPLSEDQYFEMLQAFEVIREDDQRYQMIFRIYPDKGLMMSPYIKPLIEYAGSLPNVYVSIGDPNYRVGRKDVAVLQVEQNELWHALRYSDVVINYFSTIALESCLFDTPVISMAYRPMKNYGWIYPPKYADHGILPHNERLKEYGTVRRVYTRQQLVEAIQDLVSHPDRDRKLRRYAVQHELGNLDGNVCGRLVEECIEAYKAFNNETAHGGEYRTRLEENLTDERVA